MYLKAGNSFSIVFTVNNYTTNFYVNASSVFIHYYIRRKQIDLQPGKKQVKQLISVFFMYPVFMAAAEYKPGSLREITVDHLFQKFQKPNSNDPLL